MLGELKGVMGLFIHDLVVNLVAAKPSKQVRIYVLPFNAVLTAVTQGAAIFVE